MSGARKFGLILFGAILVVLFAGIAIAQGVSKPGVESGDIITVQDVPDGKGSITEEDYNRSFEQTWKRGGLQAAPKEGDAQYDQVKEAAINDLLDQAWLAGVRRLLFLGSSCIYPKHAAQPMSEEALLTGTLEPTNEAYAIAKIAGIKLCESYNRQYGTDYRSVMPTNLYGPGDHYDLQNSHVIPAMIRKLHLAKLATGHDWAAIEQDEA
nr:NAD-dependent epimerase/dehydratase family protein [Solirubrobacterales bacterium]